MKIELSVPGNDWLETITVELTPGDIEEIKACAGEFAALKQKYKSVNSLMLNGRHVIQPDDVYLRCVEAVVDRDTVCWCFYVRDDVTLLTSEEVLISDL